MFVKKLTILIIILVALLPSAFVRAQASQQFTVSPLVINMKTMPRDIIKLKLRFTNPNSYLLELYPLINDIDPSGGLVRYADTSELDDAKSVAKWTKIRRGFKVEPGQSIEEDLEFDVSSIADPGQHFATLVFVTATNKPSAEAMRNDKAFPAVSIALDVTDNKVEKFNQESFLSSQIFVLRPPAELSLKMKNVGNVDSVPRGSIRIYDRRGREVEIFPINPGTEAVVPDAFYTQSVSWGDQKKMGRYKARLEFEYGANDNKMIQDVLFFWILPWKQFLVIISSIMLLFILMIYFLFKQTYRHPSPGKQPNPDVLDLKNK